MIAVRTAMPNIAISILEFPVIVRESVLSDREFNFGRKATDNATASRNATVTVTNSSE